MITIGSFGLSVVVNNGRTVKEILDPEADVAAERSDNKISNYIEVEEGVNFALRCWTKSDYKFRNTEGLSWNVYIDGIWRCRKLTSKEDHEKPGPTITEVGSCCVKTERGTKRIKFSFSKIALSPHYALYRVAG